MIRALFCRSISASQLPKRRKRLWLETSDNSLLPLLVELRSGLLRYEREGVLSAEQAARIFERARTDLSQTPRRLELSQDVLNEAIRILSSTSKPSRTLDALHVASCLRYGTRGFVTNDKQQAQLARAVGLEVHWLGGRLESLMK